LLPDVRPHGPHLRGLVGVLVVSAASGHRWTPCFATSATATQKKPGLHRHIGVTPLALIGANTAIFGVVNAFYCGRASGFGALVSDLSGALLSVARQLDPVSGGLHDARQTGSFESVAVRIGPKARNLTGTGRRRRARAWWRVSKDWFHSRRGAAERR
jgi:hypothetical protein